MRLNAWDAIFSATVAALAAREECPTASEIVRLCDRAKRIADVAMETRKEHLQEHFGSDYRGEKPPSTSAPKARPGALK